MPRKARARIDIARAVHRLTSETLLTLDDLAPLAGVSALTLRRWAIQGRGGVHLDAIHRPSKGWLSSRAALERFVLEMSRRKHRG